MALFAKRASKAERSKNQKSVSTDNIIVKMVGEVDRPLLIVIIALVCIGTIMVLSSSYAVGDIRFNDSYHFARSQIVFVFIGFAVMTVVSFPKVYSIVKLATYPIYIGALFFNYLVPFYGLTRNGATRWIDFMGFEFQPSELLKFALVLVLASYISNNLSTVLSVRGFFGIFFHAAPALLATLLQKHFSATIILFMLTVVMYWLAGFSKKLFAIGLGLMSASALLFYFKGREIIEKVMPHILPRIDVWFDPVSYMSWESGGKGWQPAQSLFAISSGGFWGLGLGQSNQKHGYLPEPYNDYIFAILAEELGLFGVICVVVLFAVLAYRGYMICQRATNTFSSLLAFGITSQIVIQAILNLGVVTNMLPSTGISLPFFSYGGTSLVILLFEMGILLAISRFSYQENG